MSNQHEVSKELLELTEGAGEMGRLIRAVDWKQSAVGPFENWPQSLKTALSICLGSKFPMFVWWGRDLTVFYNDAYIPFTGLKHPKYLGRPAREQWAEIWEDLRPLTEQVFETARATWSESMLLFMNRKGFLEETYFTFSYSPIRDESGAVGGIINPCQETTERVLGERRLKTLHKLGSHETKSIREVGEFAARVLESAAYDVPFALIYLMDADGKVATLIGASGAQPGMPLALQTLDLNPGSRDVWQVNRLNSIRSPHKIDGLRSLFFENLPRVPYEEKPDAAYVLPMILPNQEHLDGFVVLGISSRLAFDGRYQDFFGLVNTHIATHLANVRVLEEERRRTEALAEVDRAKTAFFSNISHEFRTPLTLMLGPIENMLLDGSEKMPASLHSEIQVVHRNALRLLKLVNTLLDFSRIEANRMQAQYEPIDLASYTSYLANAFQTAIERAGMQLIMDCQSLPAPVYVDKEMWEKIVLNLMSNAFKYTLKGKIRVSLRAVAGVAELEVRDTGTGIPAEELPNLFQRFHRVKGAQGRNYEGTGIGLALVKELIDLHGGVIEVQSVLGEGTAFIVKIPMGFEHLPKDRVLKAQENPQPVFLRTKSFVEESLRWLPESPMPGLQDTPMPGESLRKRIIVADDNADMRNYICKLLSARYEVITVTNGKEAYEAINVQRPDLILSDIMMPVMDGIELLGKIRAEKALRTIPVILLSARAGDEAKTSGIELGADDYLTKPFSSMELQARVQTQLNLAEMRATLLRELETANKELEAFSYSVSHDLRAPLRRISGLIHLLKEDCKDEFSPKAAQYFDRIRQAALKMSDLIDALLELSQYSRGAPQKSDVDLTALACQILEELRVAEPARQVETVVQPGVKGHGDPRMLRVVLENLIRNAWKYSRNAVPGVIEFGLELPKGNELIYFVKDNGAGFDMAHANRLFQAFERLHDASEYEGTGIGLATAQRIVHRHGGKIWARSQVGRGAQFYFTLADA